MKKVNKLDKGNKPMRAEMIAGQALINEIKDIIIRKVEIILK